jgi:hypothetical protein
VVVEGEQDGIVLVGPRDSAMWSPEQQADLARQLVRMADARLEELQDRDRPELEREASGEVGLLLGAWADQGDRREADMQHYLEALEDPDEQTQALVEAFLGLY